MRAPFWITVILCLSLGVAVGVILDRIWLGALTTCMLVISAISFGAFHVRSGFFIRAQHRLPAGKNHVMLTFDDGPAEQTAEVLDVLKKHKVPAMFFLIGERAEAAPEQVQRMVAEGHILGNHSYSHHRQFDFWPRERMLQDIQRATDILQRVSGQPLRYFRPPFGVTNPPLAHAVKRSGLQAIGWSLRSLDTVKGSGAEVEKKILRRLRDGDIILLHDTVPGIAGLLDRLIPQIRSRGFTFTIIT